MNQQKKGQGVYLVNKGVQIAIRPTWAFQDLATEGGAFWWNNLARLGELGGNHLPLFPYK